MFSQYAAMAEHHKENCASPIQLCEIHVIFLVMFSHGRILREHSMIFLHFSLQDYSEEQQKISAYILLIILQEYCQNYAVIGGDGERNVKATQVTHMTTASASVDVCNACLRHISIESILSMAHSGMAKGMEVIGNGGDGSTYCEE